MSDETPFDSWRKLCDTQEAIIEFAKAAAEILAAAGEASAKATGDSAYFAINRWSDIIREKAIQILREKQHGSSVDAKPAIQRGRKQPRLRYRDPGNASSLE
jgi:hypothetical protein